MREKELRDSIQSLELKVNQLTNSKPSIPSESAIQMFHQRLTQLEQDNNSDEERELTKSKETEDVKIYLKKLKNTLKIYKTRSKDFEKRS